MHAINRNDHNANNYLKTEANGSSGTTICSCLNFLFLRILPVLIMITLILIVLCPDSIWAHKRTILVKSLTAKGSTENSNWVQNKSRTDFNEGRSHGLSVDFLFGVCFFRVDCMLFYYLIVAYPNLRKKRKRGGERVFNDLIMRMFNR